MVYIQWKKLKQTILPEYEGRTAGMIMRAVIPEYEVFALSFSHATSSSTISYSCPVLSHFFSSLFRRLGRAFVAGIVVITLLHGIVGTSHIPVFRIQKRKREKLTV